MDPAIAGPDSPGALPLPERSQAFEAALTERILVLDGAMGTQLQVADLSAADFGGPELEGCNENLVLTRPDVVSRIHADYFAAGADIVSTNTFGGTPLVLAEYGLSDQARSLNAAAARLAREAGNAAGGDRWVAGAMGPTTRAISVTGGVTFEELIDNYRLQALGLAEGGADILLLETAQDTRNVKAGVLGCWAAFAEFGARLPLMISGTIEPMGSMLAGQGVEALYASVEHSRMVSIGLNCATGPEFMTDHVRTLSGIAECFVSCYPNAGLPDEMGNYSETPAMMAESLSRFMENGWLNIVGSCCGSTPEFTRLIAAAARAAKPRQRPHHRVTHLSGIDYVECEEDNRPLIIGERTNVIGSRKFKRLIDEGRYEEAAEVARAQVKAGAALIDVCLSNPDRDEVADIEAFLSVLVKLVKAPLVIDATDANVFERALPYCQGKSVLNSINLEDGEKRFRRVVPIARRFGAALVVGLIDEGGMAVTAEEKVRVGERSYQLLTEQYGVQPEDIIWDPLVFPCGTGDEKYVGSAPHTIDAVRLLKERFPGTRTLLGVSNISFGLPPAGREVLNSVFLYHSTRAGLDFAIVSSEKLVRYGSIGERERELCDNLLFNRTADPVAEFTAHFRDAKPVASAEEVARLPLDDRLARYVVEGTKEGLIADLEVKRGEATPLEIINGPLMKGMDEVGRLFGANELIVAEVLQSAEVMKAAVAHLEQFMEKNTSSTKGKLLLATVKGDVHDIGKNLVEIILGNNGFDVINLGIKVPPEALIAAVREHQPDFIGLSGLLVKSAQQMVVTAEDLKAAGIDIPMLVGGAALTPNFTHRRILPSYGALVLYAKDAMEGLELANRLSKPGGRAQLNDAVQARAADLAEYEAAPRESTPAATTQRSALVPLLPPRPAPEFERHEHATRLRELWPYLNPQALYGNHLGLPGNVWRLREQGDPRYEKLAGIVEDVQRRAEGGWLRARAVHQFFPAASEGNDIIVFDPGQPQARREICRFHFPRQARPDGLCLADFVAPAGDQLDSIAMFVTTCGTGVRPLAEKLKQDGEYVLSQTLQALAIEGAEAYAERLHQEIRAGWGIPDSTELSIQDIVVKARYQGIRVSFGYPACPDLSDQEKLWRLLKPESVGVQLTEGHMMDPEASVSAMVFHHPDARYFGVGVTEEQLQPA
ncbi:MAG: methionine synthase [Candidatus Dormibacteria bacterium]